MGDKEMKKQSQPDFAKRRKIYETAQQVSDDGDSDVVLLNGDIARHLDDRFILHIRKHKKRPNLFLFLVTSGGDADAAYRIARCAQDNYDRFTVFVSGYCKSAGTLLCLGANNLVMSSQGELGPLDVQLYQRDEIGEYNSGLVMGEALGKLQQQAFSMFEDYLLEIKRRSAGQITLKTATETAARLVVGLFEPVYCKIDPSAIGDIERSMTIAKDYGERLKIKSNNFSDETLQALIRAYPSHGFVIDKREADWLFDDVSDPTDSQEKLARLLAPLSRRPDRDDETTLELIYPNPETEAMLQKEKDNAKEDCDHGSNEAGSEGADPAAGKGSGGESPGTSDGATSVAAEVIPLIQPDQAAQGG